MRKTLLSLDPDYDFGLIGISCHSRDYRLCWAVNEQLGMQFRRTDDYEIRSGKKGSQVTSFSQFVYDDEENMRSFTLFSNRSGGGLLIPEMKQADFLMVIKGNYNDAELNDLKAGLSSIDLVLATFEVEVDSLRSKHNLIF